MVWKFFYLNNTDDKKVFTFQSQLILLYHLATKSKVFCHSHVHDEFLVDSHTGWRLCWQLCYFELVRAATSDTSKYLPLPIVARLELEQISCLSDKTAPETRCSLSENCAFYCRQICSLPRRTRLSDALPTLYYTNRSGARRWKDQILQEWLVFPFPLWRIISLKMTAASIVKVS